MIASTAVQAQAQSPPVQLGFPSQTASSLSGELRNTDLETVRVERSGSAGSFSGEAELGEEDGDPLRGARDLDEDEEAGADEDTSVPDFDLFAGPEEPASAFEAPAASAPAAVGVDAPLRGTSDAAAPAPETDSLGGLRSNLPIGTVEATQPDLAGGEPTLPGAGLANPLPRIGEDDPFAALGLRAGRFVLYPTLLQSLGYSSNLDGIPDGEGGLFSETTLSGRLISDWLVHEAEINASGTYRRNFAGETAEEPRLFADGRLRLDIDRDTTALFRGSFSYQREDPLELDDFSALSERPDVLNSAISAELERRFNRALLGVTAAAARESYSNQPASFAQNDYTTLTAALRAGYEVSPAIQPFLEGSAGRRLFDENVDAAGHGRDSLITAVRTGVSVDLGEKISGEAAVGYAWNTPDDDDLSVTRSPTLDALVAWSPRRGTDVALAATTRFEPDTADLSTTTVFQASLGVTHALTARTDLSASVSAEYSDSDVARDDETLYAAEAGFTYWLNRTLALTGLMRHEILESDNGFSDYDASSAWIGVRLQR